MVNIWFTSDTHFGHANILKFGWTDAEEHHHFLRPEFGSVEEMDQAMIDRWNAVVKPQDHIYHLGDVAMHKQALDRVMPLLSGHKRLLVGNHDVFHTRVYARWFEQIKATRVFDRTIFSHIPLHPLSVARFHANVHGHLHNNPGCHLGRPYLNISCEHTNYAPVHFDTIQAVIRSEEWKWPAALS